MLFAIPATHVQDVTVTTALAGAAGRVNVAIAVNGGWSGPATLTITGGPSPVSSKVAVSNGAGMGPLCLPNVRPWSPDHPLLYRLNVRLGGEKPIDEYAMKIGV